MCLTYVYALDKQYEGRIVVKPCQDSFSPARKSDTRFIHEDQFIDMRVFEVPLKKKKMLSTQYEDFFGVPTLSGTASTAETLKRIHFSYVYYILTSGF